MSDEKYDLEIEPVKLRVKFNGAFYELNYPTVGLQEKFEDEYEIAKEQSPKAMSKAMKDLVSGCGLPVEVIESMTFADFRQVAEALVNPKKK